jgi:hypothetical protein
MKLVLPALAALLLLGACATDPQVTEANARPNCRNVDPPTGSRLVRKIDCAEAQEFERQRAQGDARQLQEMQQLTTPSVLR